MNAPLAIIQARMGSSRLPGKVLKPILGRPMLGHIVDRVKRARGVEQVVVATSHLPQDEPIRAFCVAEGITVFSGSESDVLDRFYHAARAHGGDPLLRITGDCPLVDPELIERLLELYRTGNYDHVSVAAGAGALYLEGGKYPDGLDAECFSFAALEGAWREATAESDREHVTPYLWRVPGRFRLHLVRAEIDYSALRWTVDHPEDLFVIERIYESLYRRDEPFGFHEVLDFLQRHPEFSGVNRDWIGRERYEGIWRPELAQGRE